jgi:hypothetical protein
MALRKLAGPFNVVDETGSRPSSLGGPAPWLPYMGLVVGCVTPKWGDHGVLALDGVINQFSSTYSYFDWGWDAVNHAILVARSFVESILDGRSFIGYPVGPIVTDLSGYGSMYIKLRDRRIVATSVGSIIAYAEDGTATTEFEGRTEFEYGLPTLAAGRADDDFFWTNNSPHPTGFLQCCFYNSTSKTATPTMYIPALSGGTNWAVRYAPELQIIVAVDLDNALLSVWSLDVLPASLSDPALLSGHSAKGNIAGLGVQLLGDSGEPCEGELIDWSLTGAGELLDQQSMTDANGQAGARVFCRLSDSGDFDLTASLRC